MTSNCGVVSEEEKSDTFVGKVAIDYRRRVVGIRPGRKLETHSCRPCMAEWGAVL